MGAGFALILGRILGDDLESLLNLQSLSTIPIATGERLYTRWQFQDIIAKSAVQIVQPDIITSGGIWELRKIAAQAESREIGLAPHMPYGPISFIACLHLAAATPNHVIQEGGGNVAVSKNYLTQPLELLEGGYVAVPDRPGLGFELDEAKLKALDLLHDGNPSGHGKYALPENLGRNSDGSWAEA